jgi:tetratricopeptide (TPR) repeat protein
VRLGFERIWISNNAVRPGDSGGPLLNRNGEVVGVISLGTVAAGEPDVLNEDVCIANDPRPAIGQMNLALGARSLRSVFKQEGFRERPYVQAFRLLTMVSYRRRFDPAVHDALSSFESATRDREADPNIHFMRGILHRMMGRRAEANRSFEHVVELFEDYFPATYMLGLDRLQEEDYHGASAYFGKTHRAEPYRHLAAYGLARSLIGLHRYEEALTLLEGVLVHNPHFAPAVFDLAICHLALGNDMPLALLSARLGRTGSRWQADLERIIANPIWHPRRLEELPRGALIHLQPR